jgi:segregation and condensation protein A
MSDQSYTTYNIKLPQFEGPFDLLLFFIERDELDIHNIPIARITEDFLDYLRQMETINIELASDFILMAANLMRIKTRMLLPRKAFDEDGNEIDPREELVEKLIEYRRYKEVLSDFQNLEDERFKVFSRGYVQEDLSIIENIAPGQTELESLSLYKLLRAFQNIMDDFEHRKKSIHHIFKIKYTIQEQENYLLQQLKRESRTGFKAIFEPLENKMHAIMTFLAVLELLNQQKIRIVAGEGYNNFWLTLI